MAHTNFWQASLGSFDSLALVPDNSDKIATLMIRTNIYNTVALGGTFDRLHAGHKEFLLFASKMSKSLLIGVTDQKMILSKSQSQIIQPTHVRKQAVLNFCSQQGIKAELITLFDPFGPTIENNKIEALVCTTQTLPGANKINEIREKLYLRVLPVHVHTLKKDSQNQAPISSQRIRLGEINREGQVYSAVFSQDLTLSQEMRDFFGKLHGQIVTTPTPAKNHTQKPLRVVVGDTSLENFRTNNWDYTLGIFDKKSQRKPYSSEIIASISEFAQIDNPAGKIKKEAAQVITELLHNKSTQHLFVNGEEDLLAVVAILLLPLGSFVYYGQPNKGMCECLITEDIKESCFEALTQ